MKDVGIIGAAVACYLLVLFFQNALQLPQIVSYALGGIILLAQTPPVPDAPAGFRCGYA